ncbi:hypothetical protein C7293_04045 [filamentous cyanobacterium CCT1]|nr:hypothetical protein C7293_04045 [filamentous cyanobacterium CCT1]PSN79946.1 hypothetical protein C8B47_09065 [filamentous cyanobacterium CCP4]
MIIPDTQQSAEDSGDRSPTKTERDLLSESENEVSQPAPQQSGTVRDLIDITAYEESSSDDRSPTKTERSPGKTEK